MKHGTFCKLGWGLTGAVMVLCSVVTAFCLAFSNMAPYDDEGTMMASLRAFSAGQALYDHVPSLYGPLYYVYESLAHSLLRTSVSNDSVRFITVFFWVSAATLVYLLLYKATALAIIAMGGFFLTFRELAYLAEQPGHPQELCIVLLLGLGLAVCSTANRPRTMVLLGALAAGMILTKINVGVLVVAALGLACTYTMQPSPITRVARVVVGTIALLLPAGLMSGLLGQPWALRYCALSTISILGAILALYRVRFEMPLGIREISAAALAFLIILVGISSFVLLRGSSIRAMVDWLIVIPRKSFGEGWFIPAPIWTVAVPWAACCLLLCWGAGSAKLSPAVVNLLKLALAAFVIVGSLAERYGALFSFIPPMLWLIVITTVETGTPLPGKFARTVLLFVAVMQLLYAYPVAGSQVRFTEVYLIVIAGVCLVDALLYLKDLLGPGTAPALRRIATFAAIVLLLGGWGSSVWGAVRQYQSYRPLNLVGARRLRLGPERAEVLRELVNLSGRYSCQTLVTAPGMPSFNFWTGLPSPAELGGGNWITGMRNEDQELVALRLSKQPRVCVIFSSPMINMWTKRGVPSTPITEFIRESFHTVYQSGDYQFMVRR